MDSFNIAEGKARFSEIAARAEAGETVEITRRGRPVCKVVPMDAPRPAIDWAALAALRKNISVSTLTVEEMRRRDIL